MFFSRQRTLPWLIVLCALLGAASLQAVSVLQMDLEGLCERAERIFRGEVLSVTTNVISVAGTELPTVTYTLRVDEDFVGNITATKDGVRVAEVTMLGTMKPTAAGSGPRAVSMLPELPRLEVGRTYVLMTTAPSAAGLQTTVGLGQGCFNVFTDEKTEMATNEVGNLGLFDGPVTYDELAQQIRDILTP